MLLAKRYITQGDTRRYVIDYNDFLLKGIVLTAAVIVNGTAGTTSTVQNVTLDESATKVIFFATGGALNEVFTANVQVTDSNNEVVNDTIQFTVVSP